MNLFFILKCIVIIIGFFLCTHLYFRFIFFLARCYSRLDYPFFISLLSYFVTAVFCVVYSLAVDAFIKYMCCNLP